MQIFRETVAPILQDGDKAIIQLDSYNVGSRAGQEFC